METADGLSGTGEGSVIKGIGFIASGSGDANTCVIDVKNGKVLRIRPLHFDWKYTEEDIAPWKMEARGQVFEPMMKSLAPPSALAYKNRVYSPNRVLLSAEAGGLGSERGSRVHRPGRAQHRRTGARASTCASPGTRRSTSSRAELLRVREHVRPDGRPLAGRHARRDQDRPRSPRLRQQAPESAGRLHASRSATPDSWEGLVLGRQARLGLRAGGPDGADHQRHPRHRSRTPSCSSSGAATRRPRPGAFDGQMASRLCYWFTELGIKSIYICPDLNYGAAVHADKWIPILPNTDAALQLAIAYVWITEGTYDKEYVATHSYGFDKFADYVLGKEDGVAKTPAWAAEKCGVPSRVIKALARDWASKRTTIAHGNGGPGIRGPYSSEPGPAGDLAAGHAGIGQAGRPPGEDAGMGTAQLEDHRAHASGPGAARGVVCVSGLHVRHSGQADGNLKEWSENIAQIPTAIIPKDLIHEAILNPPISWYGTTLSRSPVEDQFTQYHVPGGRLLRDPHDLDRHALLDHLLERQQHLHQSPAEPQDRVHPGPAPLAGERLPLCRPHPAGQHQVRTRRHPVRLHGRPVQDDLQREPVHRAHRRVDERL